MTERQAVADVAAEIAGWQLSALELPVPEVQDMAIATMRGLAKRLNDFNKTYTDDPGKTGTEALQEAIAEVAREATAMAIFTLGLHQRIHLAAHQN